MALRGRRLLALPILGLAVLPRTVLVRHRRKAKDPLRAARTGSREVGGEGQKGRATVPEPAVPTSPHVRRPDPRAAEPAPQSTASNSSEQVRTGQLSGEQIRSEIVHLAQPAVWTRVSLPSGLSEANRSSAREPGGRHRRVVSRGAHPAHRTHQFGDGPGPGGPRGTRMSTTRGRRGRCSRRRRLAERTASLLAATARPPFMRSSRE